MTIMDDIDEGIESSTPCTHSSFTAYFSRSARQLTTKSNTERIWQNRQMTIMDDIDEGIESSDQLLQ